MEIKCYTDLLGPYLGLYSLKHRFFCLFVVGSMFNFLGSVYLFVIVVYVVVYIFIYLSIKTFFSVYQTFS